MAANSLVAQAGMPTGRNETKKENNKVWIGNKGEIWFRFCDDFGFIFCQLYVIYVTLVMTGSKYFFNIARRSVWMTDWSVDRNWIIETIFIYYVISFFINLFIHWSCTYTHTHAYTNTHATSLHHITPTEGSCHQTSVSIEVRTMTAWAAA